MLFSRLAQELSMEERARMIQELVNVVPLNPEPIHKSEEESSLSLEEEYKRLSFPVRLFIAFKSLLLAKNRSDIVKTYFLNRLAKSLAEACGEYVDVGMRSLREPFNTHLLELVNYIKEIKGPLVLCFEDDRPGFYAFLGQAEFPEMTKKLEYWTTPEEVIQENPDLKGKELRSKMNQSAEDILEAIASEDRVKMLEMTQNIYALYSLCQFSFPPFLRCFIRPKDGSSLEASFKDIKKWLDEYVKAVKTFQAPFHPGMFEAVFLSYYTLYGSQEDGSVQEYVPKKVQVCRNLLERIRRVNSVIPFDDLLKLVYEDPFYERISPQGGGDWYYYYRLYWRKRLNNNLARYYQHQEMVEQSKKLLKSWNQDELIYIKGYGLDNPHADFVYTMAALNTFYRCCYEQKLIHPLNAIAFEGRFLKTSERESYSKLHTRFLGLGERLGWFENHISPQGEGGKQLRQIKQSNKTHREKERQLAQVYTNFNRDSQSIAVDTLEWVEAIGYIVEGVYGSDKVARHAVLANSASLGGQMNVQVREEILEADRLLEEFAPTLKKLLLLEEVPFKESAK